MVRRPAESQERGGDIGKGPQVGEAFEHRTPQRAHFEQETIMVVITIDIFRRSKLKTAATEIDLLSFG